MAPHPLASVLRVLLPLALAISPLGGCGDPAPGPVGAIDGGANPDTGTIPDAGAVTLGDRGPPGWVPDASSPRTAITAPDEQWTYVPFPDSACGNGTPAGIGVNLRRGSRRVLIFFMGGGGCWDGLTCYGGNFAAHIRDTYTEALFNADIAGAGRLPMFNRALATNPWRDASFVFIPYCTGDIHGGDRVAEHGWGTRVYPTHHVGARNVEAYLRRLSPTFADAERVWVTGSSAGGYGAGIHWDRVADAFPRARVDLIDDSGPPIAIPKNRWELWRDAWNPLFPQGCPQCIEGPEHLMAFYGRRFGMSRMALLSYDQDQTISTYVGITTASFQMRLNDALTREFDPRPMARYFVITGSQHTLFGNFNLRASNGTTLGEWLGQFATDAPTLRSVRPQ